MANEVRVRVIAEDRASKPIGDIRKEAGGLGGAFQAAQRNWLALTAGIAATEGARRAIASVVGAASDLEESINKNRVVFKDASAEVEAFADTAAKSFGLSKNEALAATGAFGNMFNTIGLLPDAAATMSVSMTKLASDMASFNNEDPSEMLLRLSSGLAGEAEPLRRFGVLLSEAETKAFAYRNGIAAVGSALTEAEKVQARYGLILEQTAVQQGDFERTSDSLANTQRQLTAEMENLRAELGTFLLPVMTQFVTVLADATHQANELVAALREIPSTGGPPGGLFSAIGDALSDLGEFGGDLFRRAGGAPGFLEDLLREGFGGGFGSFDPRSAGGPPRVGGDGGAPDLTTEIMDALSGAFGAQQGLMPSARLKLIKEGMAELQAQLDAAGKSASGTGSALRDTAQAFDDAVSLMRQSQDALARTSERQTAEIVEAYLTGGDAAVNVVRHTQQALDAEWESMREELRDKFGIQIPDIFRGMFDEIRTSAQEAAADISMAGDMIRTAVDGATANPAAFEAAILSAASTGVLTADLHNQLVGQYLTPMAHGGIVRRPTPALVGERGPEAIVPLDKMPMGEMHVHFHGPVADRRGAEDMVKQALTDLRRRGLEV